MEETREGTVISVDPNPPVDLIQSSYNALQDGAFALIVASGVIFWIIKGKLASYFDSLVETNKNLTKLAKETSESLKEEQVINASILEGVNRGNQQHVALAKKLVTIEALVIDVKKQLGQIIQNEGESLQDRTK